MKVAATGRHDVGTNRELLQCLERRGRLGLPHGGRGRKTCGASGRPRPTKGCNVSILAKASLWEGGGAAQAVPEGESSEQPRTKEAPT